MNLEIFREYDIRGVVGKDFDGPFAFDLGQAFVTYLNQKGLTGQLTVSVGHDARLSSPKLYEALVTGLASAGVEVRRLGLITTPVSYFSTFESPLSGAIMITGSHNPPEYNGFKISFKTSTIFGDEIQKIKNIMVKKEFPPKAQGSIVDYDILTPYVDKHAPDIKMKHPLKIVVDCGNGAAGVVVRRLLEAAKIKATILFEEPDGRFPNHHPDPTVEENLVAIKAKIKEERADVGLAFDGDADRLGVVDHNGRLLFGDELMVIFARSVLETHPGTYIIGDVKCSDRLYADIEKHGGKPLMYKTGHSLIKHKMKEMKSLFSGELSGHVCFADRSYGYDDAVYAGLRFLEIMSLKNKKVPELLEGLPPSFSSPEIRIDTTEAKKQSIVAALKRQFASGPFKINDIDGVRISFDDGFALVRASNTQPVLVLRFESTTQKGFDRIQKMMEDAYKPLL